MPRTMTLPSLPAIVEILASLVMLGSVFGAFWSLRRAQTKAETAIGSRHIQFVSVCLIVPTILILGLEKVLTSETSATLIGGLAGYLLSGIGKYEPRKPEDAQQDQQNGAKVLTPEEQAALREQELEEIGRQVVEKLRKQREFDVGVAPDTRESAGETEAQG